VRRKTKPSAPEVRSVLLPEGISRRLQEGKRVRGNLPMGGRLGIDHPVPFLLVHRDREDRSDASTATLLSGESAVLVVSTPAKRRPGSSDYARVVAQRLSEQFGAFLLLEVWGAEVTGAEAEKLGVEQAPRFRLIAPREDEAGDLIAGFEEALAKVRMRRQSAVVSVEYAAKCGRPGRKPLLRPSEARDLGCLRLGLEVLPIYRSASGDKVFPDVLRRFRREVSRALRRALYDFARKRTTHRPKHFHVLGRHAVVKAVWEVDGLLADVAERFDFLLLSTPANPRAAWNEFQRSRHAKAPRFLYRNLPFDSVRLKRRLYEVPIERIEDPALAVLFREKQAELDRQITMLAERNTARFLLGSVQLYGKVPQRALTAAEELLATIPSRARDAGARDVVDARGMYERALAEMAYYEGRWPRARAAVEIVDDLAAGMMVSSGRLLIGSDTRVPRSRVEALLQHEVGTHVVTYWNACAQPFRQLRVGLAGYEALQEGLAVLAEYLVGGLSRPRLRLLAARVVAAQCCASGADFLETYRLLVERHGFTQRTAFGVAMRVHRGGGLTKDALYLEGLLAVLDYLAGGGRLRPLFVGKIAADHLPILRELAWREVLAQPPLLPRYLDLPGVASRLEALREGMTVLDLVKESKR